ncbi:MAG TPA: hypothetical protein VGO37_18865 [Steroidobacteraceae bacterium]|jgi:hypothetical protein|nr:hypothetical protein [Steroidobacteraceae bacterium]
MMLGPESPALLTPESAVAAPSIASEAAPPRDYPFVIGVTGHRNLDSHDLAQARGAVAPFFAAIRAYLPDTPLDIMLGMGAGADLVVAETALDLGLSVHAVLPMPLREYAADFDPWNLKLLKRLLAHSNMRCTVLPMPAGAGGIQSVAGRQAAYGNLADVLVTKCNLMLALWDGRDSAFRHGTADTVLRFLRVRTAENIQALHLEFVSGDAEADAHSPFAYWIPIVRGGGNPGVAAAGPGFVMGLGERILKFNEQVPAPLRHRLEDLNGYNRDLHRLSAGGSEPPRDSLRGSLPADLPLDNSARLARIDGEFGKADALALHYQKRSDGVFGLFGTAAFVMGCLYLIYDKLGERQGFLIAYLIILLGSWVLYRLLYSRDWFVKHLRYRSLAETLRVKFYLGLAGIDHRVDAAEIMALSGADRFDGFGCIGGILRSVEPAGIEAPPAPNTRPSDYVRSAWVENQQSYFARKVVELERKSRRIAMGQLATLAFMILVIVTRMTVGRWLLGVYVTPEISLKNALIFCAELSVLLLGAWKLHHSKMARRELIWQYRNQLSHFSRARAELERTTASNRCSDLLVELGKRSLMETYLWTIHRYHREHAPPEGG